MHLTPGTIRDMRGEDNGRRKYNMIHFKVREEKEKKANVFISLKLIFGGLCALLRLRLPS